MRAYLAAIPFRPPGSSGVSLVTAIGWAVVLLCALAAALYLLHRRGWLARWQAGGTGGTTASAVRQPVRIIRQATHRLGRGAFVHLIEVDGERLVVAESRSGVSIQPLRIHASEDAS